MGTWHTDVAVVGGGFAGLSAAIELRQRGFDVILLEADRVCSGASGRNGGQAIVGYSSGQEPFEQQLGTALAKQAWDMALEGIDLLDSRILEHQIECDRVKGYLYVADSPGKAQRLLAEMAHLEKNYQLTSQVVTGAAVKHFIDSPKYHAAAYETASGHLHPLKYGLGLLRAAQHLGVKVFEQTPVIAMTREEPAVLSTPKGQVHARWVVLAGNCMLPEYSPALAPELTPRIMPVGTYMVATAPIDPALQKRLIPSNAAVCDNNFVLDYYRFSADHRMLFGGRVSYTTMTPPRLRDVLAASLKQVFPSLANVPIDYVWGGFVDISMNRAPDFGRLAPHIYYLQGFSGHGVALTGLAGQVAAQAIAGQAERFDVFTQLQHSRFPGGPALRTPSLALAMLWYRLKDALG
jgi:gamma-glutamylputrescine oxidase